MLSKGISTFSQWGNWVFSIQKELQLQVLCKYKFKDDMWTMDGKKEQLGTDDMAKLF